MEMKDATAALAALSQETRLRIFRHLVAAGPAGRQAGSISEALKVAAPTLSFHMKELEHASLVRQRRAGRNIIYSANYDGMRALLSYLMEDCCGGRPEICDLEIKTCRPT
jgi:DNA-binding transcriptional ArsR family regulator